MPSPPLNFALGLAPSDFPRAHTWLRWLLHLDDPELRTGQWFVSFHFKVPPADRDAFSRQLQSAGCALHAFVYPGPDPDPPYPGGANRMFIHTMRQAAMDGKSIFWLESDMIPLRTGWLKEISQEYVAKGKPFYGPHLECYDIPHMNGTAVYPADWEAQSDITQCPDKYPWDTFSRHSVVGAGKSAPSKLIQHAFGQGRFPRDLHKIAQDAVVFHPCKDLSLIPELDPAFESLIPQQYYCVPGFNPLVHELPKPYHILSIAGVKRAFFSTRDLQLLARLHRTFVNLFPVTESEFQTVLPRASLIS